MRTTVMKKRKPRLLVQHTTLYITIDALRAGPSTPSSWVQERGSQPRIILYCSFCPDLAAFAKFPLHICLLH